VLLFVRAAFSIFHVLAFPLAVIIRMISDKLVSEDGLLSSSLEQLNRNNVFINKA
jgi:hypothetical protein